MPATAPPVAPAVPPEQPEQPVGHRRRWLRGWLIAVSAVAVLALAAGIFYAVSINNALTKNITRADTLPDDTPSGSGSPRPAQTTGALDYVLLGSDSRDPGRSGAGRSDTIMVVHLNQKRDKAYLVSFPRDMYVPIPGHGMNKVNAAFAYGGAKLTVSTLEALLGTRMDHVALIDFEGFISLTDSLGGVTVKNKHAFSSHGYTYPKGTVTLAGKKALWFVRERHSLPRGDLDRAANQRNVTKAIIDKGLSGSTVADPARYLAFISGVAQHLTVDQSLSDAEIRSTALSLHLQGSDVKLLQAPISGFGTIKGQSVDVVDHGKLKQLAGALHDDTMAAYVKKYPKG